MSLMKASSGLGLQSKLGNPFKASRDMGLDLLVELGLVWAWAMKLRKMF